MPHSQTPPPARDMVATIAAIRQGETTALAEIEAHLARIALWQPHIHAVLDLYAAPARAAAAGADPALPLAGVALGHKNLLGRAGRRLTYGAARFADTRASATAPVLQRLDAAGGIDLADLMMTEFAQGATGHNAYFGAVANPHAPDRISGGSSSGSGAAVAAGLVMGSIGSDTAGSIRIPASVCGVTGLKPSQGRVPLAGAMPLAPGFDCLGPLARSARDCALLLAQIAGPTAADPGASPHPPADYLAALTGDLRGQRIGLPRGPWCQDLAPAIGDGFARALQILEGRGAVLVPVTLPMADDIAPCLTLALRAEVAAQHLDGLRFAPAGYARALAQRMLPHASLPAAAYLTALRKRTQILAEFGRDLFAQVDLLACPTLPFSPPRRAEADLEADADAALAHYARIARHTGLASFLGLPAISLPMGFCDQGLPMGLQLIARPFGEARLLRLGDALQRDSDWHLRAPPLPVKADPAQTY